MTKNEYLEWLDANCPIGVDKKVFIAFLAMETISLIELHRLETGRKMPHIIYEISNYYKDFQIK